MSNNRQLGPGEFEAADEILAELARLDEQVLEAGAVEVFHEAMREAGVFTGCALGSFDPDNTRWRADLRRSVTRTGALLLRGVLISRDLPLPKRDEFLVLIARHRTPTFEPAGPRSLVGAHPLWGRLAFLDFMFGELPGAVARGNVFTALNVIDCSLELMAALEPGGVLHTVSA